MENFDAGAPDDAGQRAELEAGGAPDPGAIADTLYDELAQAYGDDADQYQEEEYERPTISEIAAEQRDYGALMANLVKEHPAIETKEAVEAMTPIYRAAIAEYPELEGDLELLRAVYAEVGGDERFAGALVEQEYLGVIPQPGDDLLTSAG